jgi:hypothetical protein
MKNERDAKWDTLKTYLAVEAHKVLGEPLLKEEMAYADLKAFTDIQIH